MRLTVAVIQTHQVGFSTASLPYAIAAQSHDHFCIDQEKHTCLPFAASMAICPLSGACQLAAIALLLKSQQELAIQFPQALDIAAVGNLPAGFMLHQSRINIILVGTSAACMIPKLWRPQRRSGS